MKKTFSILIAAIALAVAAPAMADSGKGKGKGKGKDNSAAEYAPGKDKGKHEFSGGERDDIVRFYDAHPDQRALPPGLAKKGKIPPGWRKKIAKGERIPDDIWAYRVPLPHEILVKLPPPPPGVIHVRIEDHVFKVIEKTHEVLDDLGLPHPPTPPRLPR